MLVVLTGGFDRFTSASELFSYPGLTPVFIKSGSSVSGRPRISKIGTQKLRNLLFMCSFNACKYNKACRDLYEGLVGKGKSEKWVLIAVCNKLLKQAFAIAKSGLIYDNTYRSVLVKIKWFLLVFYHSTLLPTGFSCRRLASVGNDLLFCDFWWSVGWYELQMCIAFSVCYSNIPVKIKT